MTALRPSRIGIAGLLATALFIPAVSAQNVGIGTTTPQSKLSVNGSTISGGIAVGDASFTSTPGTVAPSNGAIIQGDVGVGTTVPEFKLHVRDGAIHQDDAAGAGSVTIRGGGVRTFRNGGGAAIFPHVNGYVDFNSQEFVTGDHDARVFFFQGNRGQFTPI